ncbi:MAG TPA: hypothetical protein VHK05_04135 [Candidatus Limnocylindrales bacterium]|jgi:hypothetical protein|nr:hypothetical protein [Candidatus Limnocylindrales bacterium]
MARRRIERGISLPFDVFALSSRLGAYLDRALEGTGLRPVETLKHTGIVVLISRRYHEKAPGDDRLQIEPDIPVEATWHDVMAGRDPVLDAAVDALLGEAAP